jgi:hypothetical protein
MPRTRCGPRADLGEVLRGLAARDRYGYQGRLGRVFGATDGLQQPLMGELSYAQTVIGHFGHFELFPSGMGANGGCRTRTGATETVRTTLEIGGQLSAGLCVRC